MKGKRRAKTVTIRFRAEKEFKKRLEGAARKVGLDPSAYIRMALTKSFEKAKK
jgi:antitoxin component of RelBE/YafQ-DinJ toxin-antitoxin module